MPQPSLQGYCCRCRAFSIRLCWLSTAGSFNAAHREATGRIAVCCSGDLCAAGSAIAATEEPELVAPENDDRAAAKLAAAQQKEQQQSHQVRKMRCCNLSV